MNPRHADYDGLWCGAFIKLGLIVPHGLPDPLCVQRQRRADVDAHQSLTGCPRKYFSPAGRIGDTVKDLGAVLALVMQTRIAKPTIALCMERPRLTVTAGLGAVDVP